MLMATGFVRAPKTTKRPRRSSITAERKTALLVSRLNIALEWHTGRRVRGYRSLPLSGGNGGCWDNFVVDVMLFNRTLSRDLRGPAGTTGSAMRGPARAAVTSSCGCSNLKGGSVNPSGGDKSRDGPSDGPGTGPRT
jgi:hypothetical protein